MSNPRWSPTDNPATVIDTDGKSIVLDLTPGNRIGDEAIESASVDVLSTQINDAMSAAGTRFAFGRYGEPRSVYRGDLFAAREAGERESGERRTIHMGIDVFCTAGTPVQAPFHGVVEAVANNTTELDYGPVIILRHDGADGNPFFTLYGHLALETLDLIATGQSVRPGETIARTGSPPHNGNWPPHLHLQLILDLRGLGVDFPGVAFKSQQDYWLTLSPSPAVFFPGQDPNALNYSG